METSGRGLDASQKVEIVAKTIHGLMEDLSQKSYKGVQGFQQILEQTEAMKEGIFQSHKAIESAADRVTSINRTIAGIADDAKSKRSGLKELLQTVESQRKDLESLRKSVQGAVASSKEFETILSTMADISEQTSLLAMNASIQAEHAGSAG